MFNRTSCVFVAQRFAETKIHTYKYTQTHTHTQVLRKILFFLSIAPRELLFHFPLILWRKDRFGEGILFEDGEKIRTVKKNKYGEISD